MDLARNARRCTVKLYTEEGNFDVVGNNIPVFVIQNAMKCPDLVHSDKGAATVQFRRINEAAQGFGCCAFGAALLTCQD